MAVSADFKNSNWIQIFKRFVMFHLLCPGSGDRWRPGLRFCAHSDEVQGQEDCGGFGIVVLDRGPGDRDSVDRGSVVLWNRAVFLFLDFIGANGIFTNCVVKYVDI